MIGVTQHDKVFVIELQRDERRNALNVELIKSLHSAVDEAVNAGARAIVITGQGKAFCAGADLDGSYDAGFIDALYSMLHNLVTLPVVVIGAINGPAIGAGTQLALACDLRVGDERAVFAVPTARNAMATDDWTIQTLASVVGVGRARRLLLAAETFDVKQALEYGLVDRPGDVSAAIEWAQEIARLAPLSLAYNKSVLNGASKEVTDAGFAACWSSADVQEGFKARAEKRNPVFEGR